MYLDLHSIFNGILLSKDRPPLVQPGKREYCDDANISKNEPSPMARIEV
jgi:hypothetical protein